MTGQVMSVERILLVLLLTILIAFISQGHGLIVGALFMNNASAAVFLGPITTVPIMLFAGFFVRISTIPVYLEYLSYGSYLKYALECLLIIVYGRERCVVDYELLTNQTKPAWMGMATMVLGEGGDKFVDGFARSIGGTYDPSLGKKYTSSILNQYGINEDMFWWNIIILAGFYFGMRIMTYFILQRKVNRSG